MKAKKQNANIVIRRSAGNWLKQDITESSDNKVVELKKLTLSDGMDIFEMLQEIPKEENGFENNSNGLGYEAFQLRLKRNVDMSGGIGLADWMVPQTTYWLYVDGKPVGFGKIRHRLTEKLLEEGGNIGYGIRPSLRGKGYGKLILKLLIEECKKLKINEILLTIRNDNIASMNVALANGGMLRKVNSERHYFWIEY